MFSKKMRDEAYVQRLRAFLEAEYALSIAEILPGDRGWYGETWIVRTRDAKLFVKLIADDVQAARYRRSFAVVSYMLGRGIDFIGRPIPARRGDMYLSFEGGTLGVFEFVEGIHTEDYPLENLMALLAETYSLPAQGLDIPSEQFTMYECHHAEESIGALRGAVGTIPFAAEALRIIDGAADLAAHCKNRLSAVSDACRRDFSGFVLTSGDVGGNVIIRDGRMTIIDWDDMRIAPPERDLWFYMQAPDQLRLTERSLADNGFRYSLKDERLAFYCYSRWFFYIGEYIRCIFVGGEMALEAVKQLGECLEEQHFIYDCMRVADAICIK